MALIGSSLSRGIRVRIVDMFLRKYVSQTIEFCAIIRRNRMKLFHMELSNNGLVAFHYKSYGTFRLIVNCGGLIKSYNLERTEFALSFLMFKAIRILVLKLSKFRNPKALRLMTLIRLLAASSFAFE